MYKLIGTMKKFWCLEGFVAIIFSILAIRAIVVTFMYLSFWNFLVAALMTIFAYWWMKRILAKPRTYGRGTTDWHGNRDLDL